MGGIIGGVKNPGAIAYGTTTLYDKLNEKKTTPPPPSEAPAQTTGTQQQTKRRQKSALSIPTASN